MSNFGTVSVVDPNDATRAGEFDTLFKTPVVINVEHHEIHEGGSFLCSTVNATMSDTETLALCFKTPAGTKRAHMFVGYVSKLSGHLDLLEAPTWTTGSGTQQPIYNRKRLAGMTASVLLEDTTSTFVANGAMVRNPGSLAGGTSIEQYYTFGKKDKIGGGGHHSDDEWILKPDTLYALRFTADENSNGGQIMLNWYEHTDG